MPLLDFAPAAGALAPLVHAAALAAIPYAIYAAERWLGLSLTAQQTQRITDAADKAADKAYGFLVANGAHYMDVPMRNAAIAWGVNHVLASVPDALMKLGLTPDHVHEMVDARLGGLLARDPTVSIAPPPSPPPAEKPAA